MTNKIQEQKKEEALKRMRLIGLREDFIREFEQNGTVHVTGFEDASPQLTDGDRKMIQGFERDNNALVYLVVRVNYCRFGILDSLFYVSQYDEEWEMECADLKDGYALTYTVNYLHPDCSEFGEIAFRTTPSGEIIREH